MFKTTNLAWLLEFALFIVAIYVACRFLWLDYRNRQYRRYRDWLPNATEIVRTVDLSARAFATHEISETLRAKKPTAYFRSVWVSFLEEDLSALVTLGLAEKIGVVCVTSDDFLCTAHESNYDAYMFTAFGAEHYRHYRLFHPLHTTSNT